MDIFEHVKQVVKYDNLDKSCLVGGKTYQQESHS